MDTALSKHPESLCQAVIESVVNRNGKESLKAYSALLTGDNDLHISIPVGLKGALQLLTNPQVCTVEPKVVRSALAQFAFDTYKTDKSTNVAPTMFDSLDKGMKRKAQKFCKELTQELLARVRDFESGTDAGLSSFEQMIDFLDDLYRRQGHSEFVVTEQTPRLTISEVLGEIDFDAAAVVFRGKYGVKGVTFEGKTHLSLVEFGRELLPKRYRTPKYWIDLKAISQDDLASVLASIMRWGEEEVDPYEVTVDLTVYPTRVFYEDLFGMPIGDEYQQYTTAQELAQWFVLSRNENLKKRT